MHFAHQAQLNAHVQPLETKMVVGRENDEYSIEVNEINSKPKPFQFAIPVQPTNTGKQTS
jgi:hypothetical protein